MAILPEENICFSVRISIGTKSNGSGFLTYGKTGMYVVTAKHVLFQRGIELYGDDAEIFVLMDDLSTTMKIRLNLKDLYQAGHLRKHDRADVAVCRIGDCDKKFLITFLGGVELDNVSSKLTLLALEEKETRSFAEVEISNSVFLFGYPSSLSRLHLDSTRPLLRRGVVAGKTEDNRLVIDCPVYFGNSGSLVVEILDTGEYKGIGIAVEMVPFVEELWSRQFNVQTGVRYENSGYSIVEPMDRIRELF